MRFGVLGPLAVWTAEGEPVKVPELKVRALLADLLVHAGRAVSTTSLIDDLWGDDLPLNPSNTLQTRVSQLRRVLERAEPGGRDLVVSQAPGYLLRAEPEAIDAERFRALLARARATEDVRAKAALLGDALALWRGPAFADFATEPFTRGAITRLEGERLLALEDHAEVRLSLGEHQLLTAELGDLVERHPLRQRLRATYMRALYRAGRDSEALDSYHDLRKQLADDLGIDPSTDLADLYQAILTQAPELADVPAAPVATPSRPRTNLPVALTELIGRQDAVPQVESLLHQGRMVTLTGPGGVGKTRLAVEVAPRLSTAAVDGVWLVELAAIDPGREGASARVVEVISKLLGIGWQDSTAEPEDLIEGLAAALRSRELLLVLDNCEHVIDEVAELSVLLLRAAPRLRILATSREPLGIAGELVWPVPPLDLPGSTATEDSSAVRLFVARVAAAVPGFALTSENAEAVARICRRLDGLPLALELAATRIRALGVDELADRLDDQLRLFSARQRGTPARQQTLQAVIDWSWKLLTDPERVVLRRLAFHADTWTLPAAEAVCAGEEAVDVAELLARLIDRSLIVRIEDAPSARFRMLESIRAYAMERLEEAGETGEIRERYIRYYAGLADQAEVPGLFSHASLAHYLRTLYQPHVPTAGARPRTVRAPTHLVTSADGTAIAFDRSGTGPPLVVVGGALTDRLMLTSFTAGLAADFTAIAYDRRGRGASGDTAPYALDREVDDLDALIGEMGEPAFLFGVGSGAILAALATSRGLPVRKLALVEPPFILEGTRRPVPQDFGARIDALISAGRRGDAVELLLRAAVGVDAEVVVPMRSAPIWSAFEAMAHTIGYDHVVMGDYLIPGWLPSIAVPTLVISGENTVEWRRNTARVVADALPDARHHVLAGHAQDLPPELLGPVLSEFWAG